MLYAVKFLAKMGSIAFWNKKGCDGTVHSCTLDVLTTHYLLPNFEQYFKIQTHKIARFFLNLIQKKLLLNIYSF